MVKSKVRRFIGGLNEKQVEVFARIHSNPGEEAQVDFGQGAPVKVGEQWRRPWLFVMVLSYSRKLYAEVVWSQDVETFIRCHERAFLVFGGVTEVVRLDNLKSGVIKASLYEPELNIAYAAYAKHAGFSPLPCLPRRPEHKGKTEAGVKYVQENALKGMQFCSLEIQNAHLREWNRNWADQRIHGTTQIQVLKLFEEEKSYLKPLPISNFVFFKVGCRTVQLDSHISFDKAYYSVPHQYVGKKVIVHSSIDSIKILNESGDLLTIHQRKQKGNFSTEKEHFPEKKRYSRQEYQNKILKECGEIGNNCLKWAHEVIEKREALASRAIGGLLGLKKKFQNNVIEQACSQAIELGSIELYTIIILCQGAELNSKKTLAHEDESIRALSEYESILDDWEVANGNA